MPAPRSLLCRALTVLILASVSFAASAQTLSKAEAKKLILATGKYPQVLRSYVGLSIGSFWVCDQKEWLYQDKTIIALESNAMTYEFTNRVKNDGICPKYRSYEVVTKLTPRGEALVAVRHRTTDTAEEVYFRACEIDFGEITRVAMDEGGQRATISYTERYVRSTYWVDDTHNGKCTEGVEYVRTARARLAGNSWRVQ
jgi:hypothetical protein